jgi:hypothetical protein
MQGMKMGLVAPTLRVDVGYVAVASPRMMSDDSAQATFATRAERSEKAQRGYRRAHLCVESIRGSPGR